ncbi:MAG: cysteine synthase family protein [Candidatus Neomarinimicrobiota bacterium]
MAKSRHRGNWETPAEGARDIFSLIGDTPMIPLTLFQKDYPGSRVFGKAEFMNPGGSLKDRPVARMLQQAVKRGELANGKTILDSTSGNAGIAYAMFGKALGFRVELVIPGNAGRERLVRIRAHGARIVTTDPLEGYDEALREVHHRHRKASEKYFLADQYANDDNWLAHYETTAEEILYQVPDLTYFVGGIGTGGSITGIGRRLKEKDKTTMVISVRPERFPGIEGLKPLGDPDDIIPDILDETVIDHTMEVTSDEAQRYCHGLALEGLFVGQSSGAYLAAVEKVLADDHKACIVTLLNDTGERYLTTGLWQEEEMAWMN